MNSENLKFFRAIDKLDKVGEAGVFDLLTDGRLDQSGDFTSGAGLTPAQGGIVMEFLRPPPGSPDNDAILDKLRRTFIVMSLNGEEIDDLLEALDALGLVDPEDKVNMNNPDYWREIYGSKTEKPTWR